MAKNHPDRHLRPRTGCGNTDLHTVQIFQAVELHALLQHQMHAFRIKIGDNPDLILLVINKLTLAIIALYHGLRSSETSVKRACLDSICVEDGRSCRHRDGDKARHSAASTLVTWTRTWRVGNRVRN